jgi:hypothetical protein
MSDDEESSNFRFPKFRRSDLNIPDFAKFSTPDFGPMLEHLEERDKQIAKDKRKEELKFWAMAIITLLSLIVAAYQTYLAHKQSILIQQQTVPSATQSQASDNLPSARFDSIATSPTAPQ